MEKVTWNFKGIYARIYPEIKRNQKVGEKLSKMR